jgi:iron-sulfur cluster assembly protein
VRPRTSPPNHTVGQHKQEQAKPTPLEIDMRQPTPFDTPIPSDYVPCKGMTNPGPTVPVITLSENAATQVKSMQADQPENQGKTLRVYVERGGCSGMKYGLIFDEPRADDFRVECHGVPLLVDPFSAQYLQGTRVDFSDALTGGGFKILNPNARQSCGCGSSFET